MKNLTVLINPANPDPPPNYFGPPYSLSLIGAFLLKNKKPVRAYDYDQQAFSVREIMKKEKPGYIGITIQSCTRGSVYELIRQIRQIDSSVIIILGGPFASQYYSLLLKNFPVDYAVIHDGEMTLNELLDCLENKGDVRKVKGLALRSGGKIIFTGEREQIKDLDLLPYPAFHLFRGFDRKINSIKKAGARSILGKRCVYFRNSLMLLSSRGCVFHCNFCPMSKVFVNKIRYHSIRYFTDMVQYYYKKHGITNFIFGDNNFTMDRERASGICREIIKRKLHINWSCMTRSDSITRALLKEMSRAGCYEIFYGVESGSPDVQRRTGKNLDLPLTQKTVQWTEEAGIQCSLMLMVGNLGETRETIRQTLAYVKEMTPSNIMIKTTRVYPGTRIHDLFESKGLLPKNYYLTSESDPPLFTQEHTVREFKEFEEMLRPRTTRIEINRSCNNHCGFCAPDRKTGKKSLDEIRKELILASRRGEEVVLTGGEPLLRNDIF
ncbi:MAG: radical SAM protein, partial [bacterium]|nr:radical SAM protein [bacterium]